MAENLPDTNVGNIEYIERQAAIDIIEFECGEWSGLTRTIVEAIESIPAADVAPVVHGKWISECEPHYECSECHHWFHLYQYMNYCPNCGAKMDGEE